MKKERIEQQEERQEEIRHKRIKWRHSSTSSMLPSSTEGGAELFIRGETGSGVGAATDTGKGKGTASGEANRNASAKKRGVLLSGDGPSAAALMGVIDVRILLDYYRSNPTAKAELERRVDRIQDRRHKPTLPALTSNNHR